MVPDVFAALAIIGALVGVGFGVAMANHIQGRGVKIKWIFLKLYLPKYVGQYREITAQETGRVGPLYLPFALGMGGALVFGILGMVLRG